MPDRNHLHKVAKRRETELGDERRCFIEGCPADWEELLIPEGPIIVGIDGGYVRSWEDRKNNFEVHRREVRAGGPGASLLRP